MSGELIELIIRPLSDPIPPEIRLRHILKSVLRRHRYRCVSVKPIKPVKKTKKGNPKG
jgi:hypothetical protein